MKVAPFVTRVPWYEKREGTIFSVVDMRKGQEARNGTAELIHAERKARGLPDRLLNQSFASKRNTQES